MMIQSRPVGMSASSPCDQGRIRLDPPKEKLGDFCPNVVNYEKRLERMPRLAYFAAAEPYFLLIAVHNARNSGTRAVRMR